jgi:hypothetical protein
VVKQILHVSPVQFGVIGGSLLMIILTLLFSLIGAVILDKTIISWVEHAIFFLEERIGHMTQK